MCANELGYYNDYLTDFLFSYIRHKCVKQINVIGIKALCSFKYLTL